MKLHLAVLAIAPLAATGQTPDARSFVPRLEKNLEQNILSFWYPKSLDKVNGGYTISYNAKGEPNPKASKGIVTQSRQVWLFSRAAREGYRRAEMIEAAAHGFRFLRDRMWDKKNGGFYWEVDAAGNPKLARKHMYGQSFALYGLSEYYLASHDKEALDLANKLFALMEEHAHDAEYGGYREDFNADWTEPPANEMNPMGVTPAIKLMNTHLHLMESVTAYYRASKSPLARERLIELINIETNAVVRKRLTACSDKYKRDWTPLPGPDNAWERVSYGHDLENIWLITDACEAAGISPWPFADLFRDLFEYSLKYGYDGVNGGFFNTGERNKPADDRVKTWWVQAEAAVSSLYMYRMTHDPAYWNVFAKTYEFIDRYQTDWKTGEWHPNVSPELKPYGAKADIWKGGYHNGRAMMECLRLLKRM